MKIRAQNRHFYILFAVLLVMSSCVKEMDFDGAKDITLEPTMEIKLLEAKMTQEVIVELFEDNLPSSVPAVGYIPGVASFSLPEPIKKPISLTSEERILKYLKDSTVTINNQQLKTPLLSFNFTNTIEREFEFNISLLDKDGNVLPKAETTGENRIPASTNGTLEESNVSYSYSVANIKKATHIAIDFKVKNGANLYPGTDRELTINATGIFNFHYDVSDGLP